MDQPVKFIEAMLLVASEFVKMRKKNADKQRT